MIPAAFEYSRAATLAAALKAVGTKGTAVMCGGQSLIPLMRFRLARPKRVVDISGVAQLHGIRVAKSGVRIGAATTYRELLASKPVTKAFPLIVEVTNQIGDLQVRNIGTIGGGLAHADPASDMPAAMLALGASFELQSAKGKRTVAAKAFFRGPFETAKKANELLVAIILPTPAKGTGQAYESFEQAASGYPMAGAAAVVVRSKGVITGATLALTGLEEVQRLAPAAASLVGGKGEGAAIARVAAEALRDVEANDDIHASAAYRTHLAGIAMERALARAIALAG